MQTTHKISTEANNRRTILVLGDVAIDSLASPDEDLPDLGAGFLSGDSAGQSIESACFGGTLRLCRFLESALASTHGPMWQTGFRVAGVAPDEVDPESQRMAEKSLQVFWKIKPCPAFSEKSQAVVRAIPRSSFPATTKEVPWPANAKSISEYWAIVLCDLGQGFASLENQQGKRLLELLSSYKNSVLKKSEPSLERLAVHDSESIPHFVAVVSTPNLDNLFGREGSKTLYDQLYSNSFLRDRTNIAISIDTLYASGINVSSSLSWERTAQDVVAAIHTHPILKKLAHFRSLIVRIGVTGALHSFGLGKNNRHQIYYIPELHDASFPLGKFGTMFGFNSILAASIVSELSLLHRSPALGFDDCLGKAGLASVQRNYRMLRDGFGNADGFDYGTAIDVFFHPPSVFRPLSIRGLVSQSRHNSPVVAKSLVPSHRSNDWSIVNEASEFSMATVAKSVVLDGPEVALNQPRFERATRFLWEFSKYHLDFQTSVRYAVDADQKKSWFEKSVSKAIASLHFSQDEDAEIGSEAILTRIIGSVREQLDAENAFEKRASGDRAVDLLLDRLRYFADTDASMPSVDDNPAVQTPVAVIGDMILVDRQAIESFRNVANLVRTHIEAVKSGRSSRPLSIAVFGPPGSGKSFGIKQVIKSIKDVGRAVEELEYNVSQFTSSSDVEQALQAVSQSTRKNLAVAFFDEFDASFKTQELGWLKMFLGPMEDGKWGTGSSKVAFEEAIFVFAGGTSSTYLDFCREDPSITDIQRAKFSEAKGPDFVSRLRGHVDTLGVNPSGISDEAFLLRRAIQLRANLGKLQLINDDGKARIDGQMLDAILNVPYYKHGGRSLRAILDMSYGPRGVSKSSMPSIRQLNMHVDGKRFQDIVNRQ
ncbi:AAA family ATPase [Roseiconus lacunae]|uniref:AAA family ATPase n=1 Tax=Roseiconus lacunae TaxID=2605694 RepID=UPI001E378C67|nr:AAA family ATPase [Roseiconus lacunae]MCD0458165.1 AAA family ATPase [Roseiconus lacunae]